jgi:hypothetical protein
MQLGHIRQGLRAAGTALALASVAFSMLATAAPARADAPSSVQSIISPSGMPSANPILPNSSAPSANVMQGFQGILPAVPAGHASLPNLYQPTKFFHYWDYFRGWGIMRVDYVKYNWHTASKLIKVNLYHKVYTPWGYCWVESCGSGSEYNGLFTFSLDREGDGLGQLYFEGRSCEWGTYHPVGDPHHPRWFYIQPY